MTMTPTQERLHKRALELSKEYRRAEIELISLLQELETNRVHLALGFSSLFSYCVEKLELPEDRAFTFINVQRKCVEVSALKTKIEEGKICVTSARRLSAVLTKETQDVWLSKAESLSKSELEKEVAAVAPEKVRESVRVVSADRYALKLGVSEDVLQKLRRIQTLLSNQRKKPVSLEEVLAFNAEEVLKRIDPLQKKGREPKKSHLQGPGHVKSPPAVSSNSSGGIVRVSRRTPIPSAVKTAVLQRDQGQCQYQVQGHQCGSSFFVHLHHRKPVHLGGGNSLENIVVLCQRHHQYWHEQIQQSPK